MEIIVPEDITGEEKEVLAIFSVRQFFIIFPSAIGGLVFLIFGGLPFVEGLADFIIRAILFLVFIAAAICLAFIPLKKYDCYLNQYVVTMVAFYRSQKSYY
ncbi:PrgI family mobile element protein [Brevibacillus sp. 179-C9.3 HS]|uniref:PrgI family mobile element protein n=1 Tax=unclassified Brevibacillus TaxID=2684853 RepID=UPI0039A3C2A7